MEIRIFSQKKIFLFKLIIVVCALSMIIFSDIHLPCSNALIQIPPHNQFAQQPLTMQHKTSTHTQYIISYANSFPIQILKTLRYIPVADFTADNHNFKPTSIIPLSQKTLCKSQCLIFKFQGFIYINNCAPIASQKCFQKILQLVHLLRLKNYYIYINSFRTLLLLLLLFGLQELIVPDMFIQDVT